MELYIDSADLEAIREYVSIPLFSGVTTTPTFLCRQQVSDSEAHVRAIADVCAGWIHMEALGTCCEEIVSQARRHHAICDRVVSKIPINKEGLKAVRILKREHLRVNVHLIFSVNQAVLAAEAGADFVCPLIGRLNDVDGTGLQMIKNVVHVMKYYGYPTQVMASSIRGSEDVTESLLCGVDAVTIPPKVIELMFSHPLTDIGINRFYCDMAMNGSVQEVMRRGSDMPILQEQCSLLETLVEMTEKKIGLGIIVDANNGLSGVVTDGDVRRFLQNAEAEGGRSIYDVSIGEIMNRTPVTVPSGTPLSCALDRMEENRITAMVVVDAENRPIGYLNLHDVLQLRNPNGSRKETMPSVGKRMALPQLANS